jgi:hypothetical protein
VVWVSPVAFEGEPRLALTECPVSFVSGESLSWVEDFAAHVSAGGAGDLRDWPARRVDAFTVLSAEARKQERERRGEE